MPMRLEIASYRVEAVRFGERAGLTEGVLTVDRALLAELADGEPTIGRLTADLAAPGEAVRLVHLLDAVEPRARLDGGPTFPGLLGPPETVGSGRTARLDGMAVLAAARPPEPVSGLLQPREAIVDMAGPAAAYSPFGQTQNLVLTFEPAVGATNADFDAAIRRVTLRVAEALARAAATAPADAVTTYALDPVDPALPRIGYCYQIQSQGIFAHTYLYGHHTDNLVPTLIHPNEVLDGALVSGNYVYACFKNPTYLHQNNPMLHELYAHHGRDLCFAAVVLARGHNYTQMEKERSANYAAKLLGMLDLQGVVLTGEGGGNSAIDMMLICRALERAGIPTTVISYELGGPQGTDFPLVDHVPEARAIVSTGSMDKPIDLPAMDRALGGATYVETGEPATAAATVMLDRLYCPVSQVGAGLLTARQY